MKDNGKGDPLFYELTDDEIQLHDEKNQDYRSTSNPIANFDRVAAWMALYPDMNWARPEMVAILYAQKQIDAAMSLMERGVEGKVETVDTRARDAHIYWKLFRVIRRKRVLVQSKSSVVRRVLVQSKGGVIPMMDEVGASGVVWADHPGIWVHTEPRTPWQRFLKRIGLGE